MNSLLNRRGFLSVIALGFGFFGLKYQARFGDWSDAHAPTETAAGKLVSVLRHRSSAKLIGLNYIKSVPEEADVTRLLTLITHSTDPGVGFPIRASAAAQGNWLQKKLQDDFAHGRTVIVNGWLLSITEARICALAALV
jgi:hypothetical protein